MKTTIYIFLWLLPALLACSQDKKSATSGQPATAASMKFNKLTPEEERVIVYKGTEMPFTGKYNNYFEKGTYVCKRCGASLFRSSDKFKSECGWPSFDDAIPGAIKRIPDADGVRTEIECASCGAHLGHVFFGEEFTPKDERNCVNSVSLNFVPDSKIANPSIATDPQPAADPKYDTAIFAGGCFWGVEYFMKKAPGVVSTEVGYTGGNVRNPSYEQVCTHLTGHAEAVRVVYDPSKTNYESLAKYFFDIHDPTQLNGQGPDIGDNYRSEIFYLNSDQKTIAENLIKTLEQKGFNVATRVEPASAFYRAEEYHQDYYAKENGTPYCHRFVNRF